MKKLFWPVDYDLSDKSDRAMSKSAIMLTWMQSHTTDLKYIISPWMTSIKPCQCTHLTSALSDQLPHIVSVRLLDEVMTLTQKPIHYFSLDWSSDWLALYSKTPPQLTDLQQSSPRHLQAIRKVQNDDFFRAASWILMHLAFSGKL